MYSEHRDLLLIIQLFSLFSKARLFFAFFLLFFIAIHSAVLLVLHLYPSNRSIQKPTYSIS